MLLISYQVQTKDGMPVIHALVFRVWAGVQAVGTGTSDMVRSFWSNRIVLQGVAKENEALRRKLSELEGSLQQQMALARQAHALEEILDLKESMAAPSVAARVVAGDPTPGSLFVTIDRGADDGIAADMAVIARQGVVGRVIGKPLPHLAQVQLLTGRNANAGAVVERTRSGGIIGGGAGNPPLRLDLFSNSGDMKPGDRVVTSGQDGIFPPGLTIGVIERIEPGSGQHKVLAVRPDVDFSYIDVVLVLLSKPDPGRGGGS